MNELPTLEDITKLVETKEGVKALFDYMNNQKDRVESLKLDIKYLQEEVNILKSH